MARSITEKQKRFADEYLACGNAKLAAVRAGYTQATAEKRAYTYLECKAVQDYLSERRHELVQTIRITQERVLAEYARIAFFDIRKAYDAEGNLLPLHDMDADTAAAIAGVESLEQKTTGGTVKKLRLNDKKAALDSICKVLGYNAPEKSEGTLVVNWQDNTGDE